MIRYLVMPVLLVFKNERTVCPKSQEITGNSIDNMLLSLVVENELGVCP